MLPLIQKKRIQYPYQSGKPRAHWKSLVGLCSLRRGAWLRGVQGLSVLVFLVAPTLPSETSLYASSSSVTTTHVLPTASSFNTSQKKQKRQIRDVTMYQHFRISVYLIISRGQPGNQDNPAGYMCAPDLTLNVIISHKHYRTDKEIGRLQSVQISWCIFQNLASLKKQTIQ